MTFNSLMDATKFIAKEFNITSNLDSFSTSISNWAKKTYKTSRNLVYKTIKDKYKFVFVE